MLLFSCLHMLMSAVIAAGHIVRIGELATLLKRGPYPPYLHLFRAHVVWFSITTAFAH